MAECSLIPVDRALQNRGVRFIRFVDDYRIFASSFSEAHSYLHILIEELDKEGLFLNTSKTVFFDLTYQEDGENIAENEGLTDFSPIDESERIEGQKLIKVGYVSKIVKHYRYPGEEKIRHLQTLNIDEEARKLGNLPFERAEENIKNFVQIFIYQDSSKIELLDMVISKYIHSLTYIVDALIKEKDRISYKEKIKSLFIEFYNRNTISPYYKLVIVRLLSSEEYIDKDFLIRFLHDIKVKDNQMLLREFCLRVKDIEDRALINEIKNLYTKSSIIVKRAIFDIYENSSSIIEAEKRAWIKNIAVSEKDQILKKKANLYIGGNN